MSKIPNKSFLKIVLKNYVPMYTTVLESFVEAFKAFH